MSSGWSIFVIVGTVGSIIATFWLIYWSGRQGPAPEEGHQDTGHVWDGLTERNEPLPRWWLWLFLITLVWGVGYLIFYPGFGAYAGAGGWSQQGQYEAEMAAAEARYAPLFEQYANLNTQALVSDAGALKVGRSLFANYCTQCHGSLGYGAASFPNLTDADSLYGNSFESIQASILNGRNGIMPAMGAVFADDASLDAMVEYVRNLSAGADDASPAHLQFTTVCGACHGAGGEGNVALGAPRLNDDVWLYGSAPAMIADTIRNGRNNQMPAHRKLLGEDRARLVAAYVYSLSNAPASNGD